MNVAELIAKLETIADKTLEVCAAQVVYLNHQGTDGLEELRKVPNPLERFKIETVRFQVDFNSEERPASIVVLGLGAKENIQMEDAVEEFIN